MSTVNPYGGTNTFPTRNGNSPVKIQEFSIGTAVYLTTNDAPVGGLDTSGNAVPQIVEFVSSLGTSGKLVVRGMPDTINRATLNGNSYAYPSGLYLEPSQLRRTATLVIPYQYVISKMSAGGVIRVFANCAKAYASTATGALYFKDGVLVSGATTTTPAAGSVWAIFEPAAAVAPIEPTVTYTGSLALTAAAHGSATTGVLTETPASTSITVTWGDGTAAETIPSGTAITHTYAAAGSFTVTATALVDGEQKTVAVAPTPVVIA